MNELNDIIKDYLQAKETDYAIMITGDWGCGKTYYLNHELKDFVQLQVCPKLDEKFSLANISLYGISSPEDFHYRVFLGLNSWAKNKIIGTFASIGTKAAEFFGVNLDKKDTESLTFISDNTVLVFDDLERISQDKISVKEVLGLINDYSENNHYKVIIVCNESIFEGKINGVKRHDEYWRYKEKTIRYTYKFEANISNVYDNIISKIENDEYKKYLNDNKSFILSLFELGGKRNLRTLKFYLDSLSKPFSHIPNVKYKNEILRTLTVTIMIYVTEYKNGQGKEKLDELKAKYEIEFGDMWSNMPKQDNPNENEPSYSDHVAEVYGDYYRNEMDRIPFIIDYLITGYFAQDIYTIWVKEKNQALENAEVKPQYQLYRELASPATIDDDTLVEKLKLMIHYVSEGKYSIVDIMNVYALLIKYNWIGIEGVTIDDSVNKIFVDAIDRFKDSWTYIPDLQFRIPIWDEKDKGKEGYKKYDALKTHLLQMNYQSRLTDQKSECNEFLRKAENGDVEGIRHYREKYENRISLSGIDWTRIRNVLENGKNDIACELATCIQFLIPDASFVHSDDLEPIKRNLMKWLNDYTQRQDKRVRRVYILELKQHFDKLMSNH